jgi:hypothetical protein
MEHGDTLYRPRYPVYTERAKPTVRLSLMRSMFWKISIANWAVAIAMIGIAAYLGIAHPTSMFVYAALFVIGIFAFVVAILAWVVARFGVEPEAPAGTAPATSAEEPAGEAEPAVPTGA